MSYQGLALQQAVWAALNSSSELAALVGDRIHDAPPHGDGPDMEAGPYALIGEERVSDWSAQGLSGAIHDFDIEVHSSDEGFSIAKQAAEAIRAALTETPPALSEGRVVTAHLESLRARRERTGGRAVILRLRFRIEA